MGRRKGDAGAGMCRVEQPQLKKMFVSAGKDRDARWRKFAGEICWEIVVEVDGMVSRDGSMRSEDSMVAGSGSRGL